MLLRCLVNFVPPGTNTAVVRRPVVPNAQPIPSNPRLRPLPQHVRIVARAKALELCRVNPLVNKTCVPVVVRGLQPQVLIVLHTVVTFVAVVLLEKCALVGKRVRQLMVIAINVLRVKPPLALTPRAMLALRVNTKMKMAQEQHTIVKIVVPEHTATKPNKLLHHRARIVSRDDGRPRPATASVPVVLGALPVAKARTTRRPRKVPTRALIVAKASTTMWKDKTPKVIVKIAMPVRTIRRKVPLPRLLVKIVVLLNFQSSSLPLPNPVVKIVPMVTTKPPLANTIVI